MFQKNRVFLFIQQFYEIEKNLSDNKMEHKKNSCYVSVRKLYVNNLVIQARNKKAKPY
jgi:ABC-type transporter lipoprotein component MlaA